MKKSFLSIALFTFAFVLSACVTPSSLQGRLSRDVGSQNQNAAQISTSNCSSTWTTVFDASYDNKTQTSLKKQLLEEDIQSLIKNGCSFKVVTNSSNPSGSKFLNSFDCAIAKWDNAVNNFTCISSPLAEGSYSQNYVASIAFVNYQVEYKSTANNEEGESVDILIFAKK